MTYCLEIMWNIMFPCTLGRHPALAASLLWATVGAKYMSTCQQRRPSAELWCWFTAERWEGKSPGDLRENKHLSHSRFTNTHLRPLKTTREIFCLRSTCEKHLWGHLRPQSQGGEPKTMKENLIQCSCWKEREPNTYISVTSQLSKLTSSVQKDETKSQQKSWVYRSDFDEHAEDIKVSKRDQPLSLTLSEDVYLLDD